MADYTQADHTFIAHAHYVNATNYVVVGTSDDVRSYLSGTIYIDHAPIEDGTVNDPGITYEIQINNDDSAGNEYWNTIVELSASIAASTMETIDVNSASGQKTVSVGATGDLTRGDWVYLYDFGDVPADCEWAMVASIAAGASFDVVDNLANAYVEAGGSSDLVFIEGVARWAVSVDLSGVAHIRVICRNSDATGCNWATHVRAKWSTAIA